MLAKSLEHSTSTSYSPHIREASHHSPVGSTSVQCGDAQKAKRPGRPITIEELSRHIPADVLERAVAAAYADRERMASPWGKRLVSIERSVRQALCRSEDAIPFEDLHGHIARSRRFEVTAKEFRAILDEMVDRGILDRVRLHVPDREPRKFPREPSVPYKTVDAYANREGARP